MTLPTVAICIITYRRPESLAFALDAASRLMLPADVSVKLYIIDNDPEESARQIVEEKTSEFPFPVIYVTEPEKGIPHARNRALLAAGEENFIAFIDDDDLIDPRWLNSIFPAVERFEADVVQGRIDYLLPEEKEYLRGLDIFADRPFVTGHALDSAWTNNVLFSTAIIRKHGLQFDPDFTLIGGSDADFFGRAHAAGAKIIYCREAIVYSPVSPARVRFSWLARRHMRIGAAMSMSDMKQAGFSTAGRNMAASLFDSLKYSLRLSAGAVRGHVPWVHPIMVLCFMLGRLTGLMSISPEEYR